MNEFSTLFRRALVEAKSKGWTQAALAEAVGLSREAIAKAQKDPRSIGWDALNRVCDVAEIFGAAREDLLFAWISDKSNRIKEADAWQRTMRAMLRYVDPAHRSEMKRIAIEAWAAVAAEAAREERRKRP